MSGQVPYTPRCPCGCEDAPDRTTGIYELCADAEARDEMAAADTYLKARKRMGDSDDFLVGLIQNLRGLAQQAAEHGVTLSADLHAQGMEGSAFDGLAAAADEVKTVAIGPEFRVAKWHSALPPAPEVVPSSVTLYEPGLGKRRAA
jgi:hypothetical protein